MLHENPRPQGGGFRFSLAFASLHAYGYRNAYELGPAVDVRDSKLAFAGSELR